MAVFKYKARNKGGTVKDGLVEAESPTHASEILHEHGLAVLSLKEEEQSIDIMQYIPLLNKVSRKEMVLFSRQLATLINAQVPIIQSLEILQAQVSSPQLRRIIASMIEDIQGGKSLSDSIARYPKVFSNLYVNLVRSGELAGTLDETLTYLADQQEKDYDLVSKIRGALTYPIFIVSAIIIVGVLMFVFVLPQMLSVLQEAGAELPLTTRILIAVTDFMTNFWYILLAGFIALLVSFQVYIRQPSGRLVWHALKLKIPIIGPLLEKIYLDRFSRNLSTLVAGGIPIVKSLEAVVEIVNNEVYKQIILDASRDVEMGKSIAAVFEQREEMPKIVTQMIKIGEETGSLDDILRKLANFYDKEVENMLNTLTTLLEPIIMLLLGVAVAIMVAGILLPIYNLASVQ